MFRKGVLALLAVIVASAAATTGASGHGGGGGDYPAYGYPFAFSLSSERACHPVQRRVLTRSGWYLCRVWVCGWARAL